MKITTWNVNGIRAVIGKNLKGIFDLLDPDVLCLQEVKARPDQVKEEDRTMEGYEVIWNPAERPGYSGVATFSRVLPLEINLGLGVDLYDHEGRVICTRFPEFWLFNIYFPNGQHELGRLDFKLGFYDEVLKICDHLHSQGEKVILCGDFNTSHQEIDLARPKENEGNTGFLPIEREWVTRYLEHGFVDVFRRLYPDSRTYTWWTYRMSARKHNVGWRLDYFLVSTDLVEKVKDVITYTDILGSDHCPVTLVIET